MEKEQTSSPHELLKLTIVAMKDERAQDLSKQEIIEMKSMMNELHVFVNRYLTIKCYQERMVEE